MRGNVRGRHQRWGCVATIRQLGMGADVRGRHQRWRWGIWEGDVRSRHQRWGCVATVERGGVGRAWLPLNAGGG